MIQGVMTGRHVTQRFRRYACLALGLFAIFLVTAQFEHHDIACHLKNPQHCSACASSPVGSDPKPPASFNRTLLPDAGGTVSDSVLLIGTVLPARSSGRSPPASA
jgi:hypothetical protein